MTHQLIVAIKTKENYVTTEEKMKKSKTTRIHIVRFKKILQMTRP